jgi:hypothetical protein
MRPNIRPVDTGGPRGANSCHDNPATTGQNISSARKKFGSFVEEDIFLSTRRQILNHYSVKFYAYFSFNVFMLLFVMNTGQKVKFFFIRPLLALSEIIRFKFGPGFARPLTFFSAIYDQCSRIFCQLATGQGEGEGGWC